MTQPFVIYTSQRTGSTMLRDVLSQIEGSYCFPELFRAFDDVPEWLELSVQKGLDKKFLSRDYRENNRLAFFDSLMKLHGDKALVGFKLMSLQDKGFLHSLVARSPTKVIHLYRDNMLAVYGAAKQAQKSGKAHIKSGETFHTDTVQFDSDEFSAFLTRNNKRIQLEKETLNTLEQAYLSIEYVTLSQYEGFASIFNFLDIKVEHIPHSTYIKRNSWDVLQRFSNPDTVSTYLKEADKCHWSVEKPPTTV
ncbi:hypothetical protein KUL17_21660 [Alteromonas sp. KUL17]|uniref:hypothetical protein n=1 Tax=Alteromonas sp. KUL17 TaxID=2480796 RepID=UPI0010377540|nr:hypothetical protein [Alteromonas sp. KUL17]TAP26289.1 hypothetical protein KUL49_10780 [Alteromonas sp. KUL17]GEA03269.1 hypothetical protein KUL17_21660 [Alteromonas sp. KUL17]